MLLLIGVILVVIGFQGSAGKVFAVAFAPAILGPNEPAGGSTGQF